MSGEECRPDRGGVITAKRATKVAESRRVSTEKRRRDWSLDLLVAIDADAVAVVGFVVAPSGEHIGSSSRVDARHCLFDRYNSVTVVTVWLLWLLWLLRQVLLSTSVGGLWILGRRVIHSARDDEEVWERRRNEITVSRTLHSRQEGQGNRIRAAERKKERTL